MRKKKTISSEGNSIITNGNGGRNRHDTLRVAGYVRVSTTEQVTEGYSISEQSERIALYCNSRGWNLANTYTDGGYSGANMDRPGLQALIRDCGRYDAIVVYKLDRLSRSQKDTLHIIEDVLKPNNTAFVSMQENFDTGTPFGLAMVGILSVFAQLEREQIRERMQLGKQGRAKEGYYMGTYAPIGYNYVSTETGKRGALEVNPEEAEQVREIFRLYLEGHGLLRIAEHMTARYATRNFSANEINYILRNALYAGYVRHAGQFLQGNHDAIIDRDTWDATQALIQRNSDKRKKKEYRLLSGLCHCGQCGGRIIYNSRKRKDGSSAVYLRCANSCGEPHHHAEEVESAVLEMVSKMRLDNASAKHSQDSEPATDRAQNAIKEIDRQIDRALRLYTLGTIDEAKIKSLLDDLQGKRDKLVADAQDAHETRKNAARRAFDTLGDVLRGEDEKAIKTALRLIIDHITICGQQIEIVTVF